MPKKFFWIDMEMTGLDEKVDHILEVAVVITDTDFNALESYEQVVFQPPEIVAGMNAWCKDQHGKSGLTSKIPSGKPLVDVEKDMMAMVERHFDKKTRIVLCGNSVGNDRRFIDQYMKIFSQRLHYRLIDVSSFKEIFREKYGVEYKKEGNHRALDDIHASIDELKTYLAFVSVPPPPVKSVK